MADFYEYVQARPELHAGAPHKFVMTNQRHILLALEKRRRNIRRARLARKRVRTNSRETWVYEMNEIDRLGLCPHEIDGLEEWDFGSSEQLDVVISDRKIVLKEQVSVNHIQIEGNGMLVFGQPNSDRVELRAKSVNVTDGGEFWIGSRACRYEFEGYLTLYGNHSEMYDHPTAGQKYLWCREESTCEFHGKEKKTWTFLNEHLFAQNSPITQNDFSYSANGFFVHRLDKQGGWKDAQEFRNLQNEAFQEWYDSIIYSPHCETENINCNEDIFVIGTTGRYSPQNENTTAILRSWLGIDIPESRIQFAAIIQNGIVEQVEEFTFSRNFALKNQMTGFDFDVSVSICENAASCETTVSYSSTMANVEQPIITLADDVSSWNVGDGISVGSTDYSQARLYMTYRLIHSSFEQDFII